MDNDKKAARVLNKRPLLLVAAAFGLGVILGNFFHFQTFYIIAAAAMSGAAVYFFRKKAILFVCAAAVLFAAFLSARAYDVTYVETGDNMQVSGRVYSEPYVNDYGSTICLLDEARIGGLPCGNIKLYVTDTAADTFSCGDVVSATADVDLPKSVRNPGGFDDKMYLLSQGIHYKAYADDIVIIGQKGGLPVFFSETRAYLGGVVDGIFEKEMAPIAKAMLLGDTRGIDEETTNAFKDTGMAHVLAVSGLNAAILIGFIYYLLKMLKAGRTPRLIVTLIFVAVYMCITGLTPSIVRASIMAGTVLLGKHFGKQTDTLNVFALSFLIILIINPLDLFSVSFQLSFGAVFGMLTLGWQMSRWMGRKLKGRLTSKAGEAISVSVGATAGTMPILAASFNRISTLSIVINIFVIPLASAATVLVFIATFAGIVLGPLAVYVAYIPSAFIRAMMAVINLAASVPFIAMDVASPPWYGIAACFIILFISSKYVLIQTKMKTVLCTAVAAAVLLAMLLVRPTGLYMVFLDVGQGDAVFIRTVQGGDYFIDGGRESSADEVVSFVVRNGYTPDAAFVSHTDDDHFYGITALYEAGLLDKIYCSWREEETAKAAMPDAEVIPLAAGDTVLLDENTRALVLYPYKETDAEDKNDTSLVLLIEYNGHKALLPGDISGDTETQIFAGQGNVDIYKATHHGSKYSSYRLPLSVLSPDYSVVSVGANTYGHPDPLAIKNLQDYSGEVLTTVDDYAVEFYIGDTITMNTYGD